MEEVGFVFGKTCGAQKGAEELSLFKNIQALLELIDDQAVGLVNLLLLQAAGFDPTLELLGKNLDGRSFFRGGIGFDQGPVSFLAQHMNGLAGAGHNADIIGAFLIRFGQNTHLFPLLACQDGHRLGEHLPDIGFIHMAHFQVPEARIVIALNGAVLIGRMVEDIGGEKGIPLFRDLLPFLSFFPFLVPFFRGGKAGKEKQESQEKGKEFL